MSIYSLCSLACDKLIKGQARAPHLPFFTELDVVNEASKLAEEEWTSADYRKALRRAQDAIGTKWRERKLYRYGPVIPPGVTEYDYARIATKIVYASVENAPEFLRTPNGDFPRFRIMDDPIKRQGRRMGTNRDDLKQWDDQDIRATGAVRVDRPVQPGTFPMPPHITHDEQVRALLRQVEDLTGRVDSLEAREKKRAKLLQEAGVA